MALKVPMHPRRRLSWPIFQVTKSGLRSSGVWLCAKTTKERHKIKIIMSSSRTSSSPPPLTTDCLWRLAVTVSSCGKDGRRGRQSKSNTSPYSPPTAAEVRHEVLLAFAMPSVEVTGHSRRCCHCCHCKSVKKSSAHFRCCSRPLVVSLRLRSKCLHCCPGDYHSH